MSEKERRNRSNTIESKATQAPYFKGIFEVSKFGADCNQVEITDNKKF